MAITVYGRREIRRIERATGLRVVHAAGPWATTVEHWHLQWDEGLDLWVNLGHACEDPRSPIRLTSCGALFGLDAAGRRRHFMLGACEPCRAGPGEGHRWDCDILSHQLAWRSVSPDYWPKPVHRPLWVDDPRRREGARWTG